MEFTSMGSGTERRNGKRTRAVEEHARAGVSSAKERCDAAGGGRTGETSTGRRKDRASSEARKQAKAGTGPNGEETSAGKRRKQSVPDARRDSGRRLFKRKGKHTGDTARKGGRARRAGRGSPETACKSDARTSIKLSDVAGADEIERDILEKGTVKDKINTLTLLVARDPQNDDAFSRLLDMCSGQRHDVVLFILQNATDLILNGFFPLDKKKLKRILEEQARNKFIQNKVIRLIHELLRKGVLVGDVLHIFINRLGAKECRFVMEKLETLYHRSREQVLKELRTFYYKYSDLRGRNNVMKLLNVVCGRECLGFFIEVFNDLDLYGKGTQSEKLLERSVSGLYKLLVLDSDHAEAVAQEAADACGAGGSKSSAAPAGVDGEAPRLDVAKLVLCCKKRRVAVRALSILSKVSETAFMETLMRSLGRESLDSQAEYLNMIYDSVKENRPLVVERLMNTALHMNAEFVCGVIILMKAFSVRLPRIEALLAGHFSPAVRYLLIEDFSVDPFKAEDFQKLESIAATYFAEATG